MSYDRTARLIWDRGIVGIPSSHAESRTSLRRPRTEVLLRDAILSVAVVLQTVAEMYHPKERTTNEIAPGPGYFCSCCEIPDVSGQEDAASIIV